MLTPVLVIITGPPCTGKSTLCAHITAEFGLPSVSKDGIKERLYDTLGWSDRAWSRKLGVAASDLLYYFADVQLAEGRSCIIESNFPSDIWTGRVRELGRAHSFTPFQIQCYADPDVLLARSDARATAGARHPGHLAHTQRAELEALFATQPPEERGRDKPMDIGGTLFWLDTTDPTQTDYAGLIVALQHALA